MGIRISQGSDDDRVGETLRTIALAVLGAAAVAAVGVFVVRNQMVRHQQDLFSPHPMRRLAALGYLRSHPNVDNVTLLRDFLVWEERPLLQKRAVAVLDEMEHQLALLEASSEEEPEAAEEG